MPRLVNISGVHLHANTTACAYHCRYCQLHSARTSALPFERYARLVRRFIDWRAANGRADFDIAPWFGNSYEHDLPTLAGMMALEHALGHRHGVVLLGGLRHRSMAQMRIWLEERRALGIDTLVATFSGHGALHDHWNNQPGNYRFQLDCLYLAAELGMKLQQRMLMMCSNLATLPAVIDDLDAIPGAASVDRWAIPMFYSGRARQLEAERLTEADFASMPARLRLFLREDFPRWRAERRWIEHVENEAGDEAQSVSLALDLSPAGLDWAESHTCDEIVDTLTARYLASAARLPARTALCNAYADRGNERVYFNLPQMECLWMERYLADHPDARDAASLLFP